MLTSTEHEPSLAESMNGDLRQLYESYLPEIRALIDACRWESGVSQPFIMHVAEEYIQAQRKIMFVGRETYGWGNYNSDSSVVELREEYKKSYERGVHYNSPFWWFRQGLSLKFGISETEFMKATLWTNLSKVDVKKQKPQSQDKQFDRLIQLFIKLLIDEISIVKPDVVVIMTRDGFYNWHLDYYNWQENKSYFDSDHAVRLGRRSLNNASVDQLEGGNLLPIHTYQMCHPNALRYKGDYTSQADQIIHAIHQSVTDSLGS